MHRNLQEDELPDSILVICFVVLLVALLASIFRCRRLIRGPEQDVMDARFTALALEEAKIQREKQREKKLMEELKKVQRKLNISRHRKMVMTARKDAAKEEEQQMIEDGISKFDAKGRLLYGDAWDQAQEGNVPLRELLSLPEEELRLLRVEAYKQIAEWEQRKKAQGLSDTPKRSVQIDPRLIGRASRSQDPHPDAPYDDSRFVQPRSQRNPRDRKLSLGSDPAHAANFLGKEDNRFIKPPAKDIPNSARTSQPPKGSPYYDTRFFDSQDKKRHPHQPTFNDDESLQLPRPLPKNHHKKTNRIRLLPDPTKFSTDRESLLHPHQKHV